MLGAQTYIPSHTLFRHNVVKGSVPVYLQTLEQVLFRGNFLIVLCKERSGVEPYTIFLRFTAVTNGIYNSVKDTQYEVDARTTVRIHF